MSSSKREPLAKSVVVHLLLTFALGWAAMLSWTKGQALDLQSGRTNLVVFGLSWLPFISAAFCRRVLERDSMSGTAYGSFRRPQPLHMLAAMFSAPLVFGVIFALSALVGGATFDPSLAAFDAQITDKSQIPPHGVALGAAFFASLSFGFLYSTISMVGEAYGWFSFLAARFQSRFQSRSSRWIGAAVGLLYGLFYSPLAVAGFPTGYGGANGVLLMLAWGAVLGLIAVGIWMRTQSVWVVAAAMGAIAAQDRGVWPLLFPSSQVVPWLGGSHGVVGILVLGCVGLALFAERSVDTP